MNERIKPLLVLKGTSIRNALKIINEGTLGVALVVDESGRLIGLVTDGDIRRAIISGINVESIIDKVIPKKQIVANEDISSKQIMEMMSDEIRHIPIIDSSGKLIDLASYMHYFSIPIAEPTFTDNEMKNVVECIETGWVSSKGKFISKFEEEFSRYCNVRNATSTCNGTVALHLALAALGIGLNDEVIIPDLTFVATASAIVYTGAKPVFADIDPKIWTIDPKQIEEKITKKTKAIIPVHLYGHPADMNPIMELARKHNLYVIEDAAEAHGAEYKHRKVGSIGDIGCFSFFGNKIITTGEGGMCITNNDDLINNMRMLKNHGMSPTKKYWHTTIGFNYRMTNIQAAIGSAQLEKIDKVIEIKRRNASLYNRLLREIDGLTFPKEEDWAKSVYWMYSIQIEKEFPISRDSLIIKLNENNIDSRPFFYPLHKMPPFKSNESYPVSEEISRKGISLPSSPNLTIRDIEYICNVIKKEGKVN
jgi:perosamine synthetase